MVNWYSRSGQTATQMQQTVFVWELKPDGFECAKRQKKMTAFKRVLVLRLGILVFGYLLS